MKTGDRFYHAGSWNTEPGWWEVTVPDCGCSMTKARPIDGDRESEWFTDYVENAVSQSEARMEF